MIQIKGVGLDSLRQLAKKQGEAFEKKYMESLSKEEKENFKNLLPISWRPLVLEKEKSSLYLIADMLFPNDPDALKKTGHESCKLTIPKFYQIFIRIPKPKFVIGKAAAIWKSYYNKGSIETVENSDRSVTIILRDFPEFPEFLRDFLCGYIEELFSMIGIKDAQVEKNEQDPNAWKWELKWNS